MQLIERLKGLEGSLKAILALIALLPSLAAMVGLFPVPDQISTLVTFLFGFLGLGVVLLVAILSNGINQMTAKAVAVMIGAMLLLGMTIAICYMVVAERRIVTVNNGESVEQILIPLSPDANLRRAVDAFGGDYREALQNSNLRPQIIGMMRQQNAGTEVLMVLLLVFGQVLLVGGVTVAAWRTTQV